MRYTGRTMPVAGPNQRSLSVLVVTPSFDQRSFIEATIESVLSQDYPSVRYRIVDGGSTDGTCDVLRKYDGRLQWTSSPDSGQADAINRGFADTSGDILAWLNSDDTYEPGAISAAVNYLNEHPDV